MSIKTTKNSLVAVLLGVALSFAAFAAQVGNPNALQVTKRSLSDFLGAQGTTSSFFPPVPDYAGWTDGDFESFALVDYAGLANEYLDNALGTAVSGTVIERARADGRAEITVNLKATNAMGFAQSIAELAENNFDFVATPTIFGNKAMDVLAGAPAAVGPAQLSVSFTIAAPGAALPNLIDVLNASADYQPVRLHFNSVSFDGKGSQLRVQQEAATVADGQLVFTKEVVEIGGKR